MARKFNADEVFEIGEQIERNGRRFYQEAAEEAGPELKALFRRLADMEKDHEELFHNMRLEMAEGETEIAYDPDQMAPLHLQSLADTKVFNVYEDRSAEIAESESPEEVIRTAIEMEKDSVVLYVGMKGMVPGELGKDKIDWLIGEEMAHIQELSEQLGARTE